MSRSTTSTGPTVQRSYRLSAALAGAFRSWCAAAGFSETHAIELLMSYAVMGHLTPTMIAFHDGRTTAEQLEAALAMLRARETDEDQRA